MGVVIVNLPKLGDPAPPKTTVGGPTPSAFPVVTALLAVCWVTVVHVAVAVVTGKDTIKLVGCPCIAPVEDTFKDNEIGCEKPGNCTCTFCKPDMFCSGVKFRLCTLMVLVFWGGGLERGDITEELLDLGLWMKCVGL